MTVYGAVARTHPTPMPRTPTPLDEGRDNLASEGITRAKLNGQVYTPLELARQVVDGLRWPHGAGLDCVDPTCGDGIFLQAAVERLAAAGLGDHVDAIAGFDIDPDAVEAARARLDAVCHELGLTGRPRIEHRDALRADFSANAVIGNPPYLEAKRMPDAVKAQVRATCPVAATGAFDLYAAVTERAVRALAPGGELAFVVPNRVLVTRATAALRTWLVTQGRVSVRDLSEDGWFGAVAVYPVVLGLDRAAAPGWIVSTAPDAPDARFTPDAIERIGGRVPLPRGPMCDILRRVLADPDRFGPLSRGIHVRWTVSFHRRGLRDAFVFTDRPDSPHARRFLGGVRFAGNRELAPYRITWAGTWIDYDVERAKDAHNGLPPIAVFDEPHVVIPQNARRPRAALDRAGHVLKDTFLAGVLRENADPAWLPWLTVVLNSAFGHHLYEALFGGTRKGGGYLQLLGSYLHGLPIPDPPAGIDALHARLAADPDDDAAWRDAEQAVRAAWRVTEAESAALDALPTPAP